MAIKTTIRRTALGRPTPFKRKKATPVRRRRRVGQKKKRVTTLPRLYKAR